jgi:hypothetical protein
MILLTFVTDTKNLGLRLNFMFLQDTRASLHIFLKRADLHQLDHRVVCDLMILSTSKMFNIISYNDKAFRRKPPWPNEGTIPKLPRVTEETPQKPQNVTIEIQVEHLHYASLERYV